MLIVWVTLMVFTVAGYFSSEEWFTGKNLAIVLMLVTAVKFIGVSFWFMEAKHAHKAWIWALGIILISFSILIILTTS